MKKVMPWQKKQIFCVSIDMFDIDVLVAMACAEKDVANWLKKKGDNDVAKVIKGWDEDSSKTVSGRAIPYKGGFIVFINSASSRYIPTLNTIVHEMTHVTHDTYRKIATPLTEETEELYAYLVAYLVKEVSKKTL